MYVKDGKKHNHLIWKNKGAYENSFDRLFDFNRDGSLDPAEQGFQLDFITEDIERDNEYDDEKSDDYTCLRQGIIDENNGECLPSGAEVQI